MLRLTCFLNFTKTFTTFVLLDLVSAISNRGLNCSLTANRMLLLTCSVSFLAQLGLIYVPLMQGVFQTEALSRRDLATVLAFAGASASLHWVRRMWERGIERSEEGSAGVGMLEGGR